MKSFQADHRSPVGKNILYINPDRDKVSRNYVLEHDRWI